MAVALCEPGRERVDLVRVYGPAFNGAVRHDSGHMQKPVWIPVRRVRPEKTKRLLGIDFGGNLAVLIYYICALDSRFAGGFGGFFWAIHSHPLKEVLRGERLFSPRDHKLARPPARGFP